MLSELRQFYTPENIALATSPLALVVVWIVSVINNVGRYLSWSAFLYWYYYKRSPERLHTRKLQDAMPTSRQIKNEIQWSLCSCLVYSVMTVVIYYCAMRGWTRIYLNVSDYGWGYLFLSIVIMLILHDAYFYFTHLASHRITFLFRRFHRIHHQSANPTPFADIMFHPVDAVVHAGFVPLFLFLLPVHPIAFALFLFLVTLVNCIGHSGFEPFPAFVRYTSVLKWINYATLHNIHHSHIHYNFGLYFRFYDHLLGTERLPAPSRSDKDSFGTKHDETNRLSRSAD